MKIHLLFINYNQNRLAGQNLSAPLINTNSIFLGRSNRPIVIYTTAPPQPRKQP